MADLRIILGEDTTGEGSYQDDQDDSNGSVSFMNNTSSLSSYTGGYGIMSLSDVSVPSPLDVTTPEELLTPLARLRSHTISDNIFNRRMIAHEACHMLNSVQSEPNDFNSAVQCYLKLSEDLEPSVRVELMDQMLEITETLQERLLNSTVIPIILRYLTDVNNQVRKSCHTVLVAITEQGYIKVDRFEKEVLPLLSDLTSRQQAPDEYRTEAVALVCQICGIFGRDFAELHFLPIFLESCSDETMFHVRKVCAANFSSFCNVFDNDLIKQKLLPRFIELCKDMVWGVRKSCAENFPDFANHVSEEVRLNVLSPLFISLLSDQSRWVRVSAFESLGPFISTFADSQNVSDNLTRDVAKMQNDHDGDFDKEEKIGNWETGNSTVVPDFESFLFWRDPIPPIIFDDLDIEQSELEELEEDGEDEREFIENHEGESHEIQSQVYVNSAAGKCNDEHASMKDEEDVPMIEESLIQEQEYSPTKDNPDVLKSVEFSAVGPKLDTDGKLDVKCNGDVADDEYESLEEVPSICLKEKVVGDEEDGFESKDSKDEDVVAPEVIEEPVKEEIQDRVEVNKEELENPAPKNQDAQLDVRDDSDEGSDDGEDYFDEPRNWQAPNMGDFPDLYSCNYDDGNQIDYRIFGSISEINPGYEYRSDRADRGSDTSSTCDHMTSVYGPSTSNCQQDIIPQRLLDDFLSMTDPSRKQTVDSEIAKHCAYSLPGVAYTLGPKNWHCLKDVYQKLATDVQWKVRRTIASSIHELAKILGEDLTASELVPVFNGFLKDLDDVRIGVLRHLADFLQLLKPEVRGIYLYQLTDFLTIDNSRDWRFRFELAHQLCSIIELYNADDINRYICPISVRLATDKVVAVQEEAIKLVAVLFARLEEVETQFKGEEIRHFESFVEKIILYLAKSKKWRERSVFCKLCSVILKDLYLPYDLFLQYFCPFLLELATDKIVNVRINVARVLSHASSTFCDDETDIIFTTLKELQSDKDKDVRYFASV